MAIVPGTQLGRYEIRSKIGAGGMGEVYRARDEKLNRDVAIKVLPAALSQDSDRLRRFEQEAQAAGALNHPNILAVYDVGMHDGSPYIVSELLEGEELREQLNDGALPQRKALEYAQQIAQGLAAAHERGITHRDLKPENLFVTTDGRLKILDFGLAKLRPQRNESVSSEIDTRKQITDPGTVMGTVGYMSPEQVRGHEADHRSDIFSFGSILYEMLAGQRAFRRETMAETMTAILKEEPPDITETNSKVPAQLERIVRRCLEKKPERRFHSAHDLGFALEAVSAPSASGMQTVTAVGQSTELPARKVALPFRNTLLLIIGIVLAFLAGASGMWLLRPASSEIPLRKLELQIAGLDLSGSHGYCIAPNGRQIAYISNHRLWIRDLDRLEPREVPNTENAGHPFWSPDSAYLGYVIGKKMWKVSNAGAGSTAITDLPDLFSGAGAASWRADGVIIFTTGGSGLMQVAAQGGDPTLLLNVGADEADFHDVSALPDGHGVLFAVHRSVQGVDTIALFDGKSRKNLLQLDSQWIDHPVYSRTGHILFERRRTNPGIWALPFSLSRLDVTGEPFLVVPGAGAPRVADDGTLVFAFGDVSAPTRLVWMDRAGKIVNNIQPEPLPFQLPSLRLSPDGKQLVQVTRESGKTDYWIVNLARGTRTRLTFENSARGSFCGWTPDGQRVMYSSGDAPAVRKIMLKAADGSGDAKELLKGLDATFSLDGKFIIYGTPEPVQRQQGWDLWYVGTEPGAKPLPFLVTPKDERYAEFSPDGNYVAYASNESGRYEVYVMRFPNGEGKSRVSIAGGSVPRWSRRGDELFYVSGNDIMAVHVQTKPSLVMGQPQKLFSRRPVAAADRADGLYDSYDVSADGQRFVMLQSDEQQTTSQKLNIIQNWFAEFKDRQPK